MRPLALAIGLLCSACLAPITSEAPGPATAPGQTEAVATGARAACALMEGGAVRCWGAPGLVGDGSRSLRVEPVQVKGLSTGTVGLAAGVAHTCALSASGQVRCWGDNARGELGLGSTEAALEPAAIPELTQGVTQVAAGAFHTCALLATGEVRCWGVNDQYQLGAGAPAQADHPVPVAGLQGGVRQLAAGAAHTCAVTANGEVHCWGGNAHGELGLGIASAAPVAQPSQVQGLPGPMMMVAAGRFHTCAVSPEGALWCWGQNQFGALGDDTSLDRSLPVQPVGLGEPAVALTAGAGGTCAVLRNGDAYCWGSNANGQLGDGSRIHRARPVKVLGLEGAGRMVAYGEDFSCATTRALRALCWGKNDQGQLGDGTDATRETPAPVLGL
jgi:alpha-tubulin suppressor-like RCC1 family protein